MITLQADNRTLTSGMPFTTTNITLPSGTTSFTVGDCTGLVAGQKALLGVWGSENSEVITLSTVTTATRTVTCPATVKPHPESTRLTLLKYDQAKFYWTATSDFSYLNLLATVSVDPTSYYTVYRDLVHSSGYGWFTWVNSVSSYASANSNAIPYANFQYATVKRIIDSFYSKLNQVQAKTVSMDEAMLYLNEAYSTLRAELNMVNRDYTGSVEQTVAVVPSVAEYPLPDRFSDLLYIRNASFNNQEMEWSAVEDIGENSYRLQSAGRPMYYIRGNMLGFIGVKENFTATYRYAQLPNFMVSYSDVVDLPDDNFWPLVHYMLVLASVKLNFDPAIPLALWKDGLSRMKIVSVHRSSNKDAWTPMPSAFI